MTINDWVAKATEDRIKDLIPQGAIDAMTRLVLTNAIYFNGDWKTPFTHDATAAAPFHALTGDVSVPTMRGAHNAALWSGTGWNAAALDYAGDTTSMIVVVPDAGTFDAFEAGLTASSLGAILAGAQPSGGADLISAEVQVRDRRRPAGSAQRAGHARGVQRRRRLLGHRRRTRSPRRVRHRRRDHYRRREGHDGGGGDRHRRAARPRYRRRWSSIAPSSSSSATTRPARSCSRAGSSTRRSSAGAYGIRGCGSWARSRMARGGPDANRVASRVAGMNVPRGPGREADAAQERRRRPDRPRQQRLPQRFARHGQRRVDQLGLALDRAERTGVVARIEQRPRRLDVVAGVNGDLLDGKHAGKAERARHRQRTRRPGSVQHRLRFDARRSGSTTMRTGGRSRSSAPHTRRNDCEDAISWTSWLPAVSRSTIRSRQ